MINLSPTLIAVIVGTLITAFVLSPVGRRVETNRLMFRAILVVIISLLVGNAVALVYYLVNDQATVAANASVFAGADVLSSPTASPSATSATIGTAKSTIVSTPTQRPLPPTATVVQVTPTQEVSPSPLATQTTTPEATNAPTVSVEETIPPPTETAPPSPAPPAETVPPVPEPLLDVTTNVTIAGSNIRSGPGIENLVVGEVERGDELVLLGMSGNWYLVRLASVQSTRSYITAGQGWISKSFVSPPSQPIPEITSVPAP